jgi:hypothetical protein
MMQEGGRQLLIMAPQYGSIRIEQLEEMEESSSPRRSGRYCVDSSDDDDDDDDPETRHLSSDMFFGSSSRVVKMVKVVAISCLIVTLFQNASGWVMPKNSLQKAATMATISAVIATAPMTTTATDFTGSYADPNHPNCLRDVQVIVGTNTADVSGTDGNPGCPADGSGDAWDLSGKIDGDSLLVDFTPKGGPKDLKGVWEAAPVPGIRWPDGNIWYLKGDTQ